MTKKPVSNVGASVRQRLLNLRNQTGEDAHALFTQFAIERFLYRLSQSAVADMIRQIITTTVEEDGISFEAASILAPRRRHARPCNRRNIRSPRNAATTISDRKLRADAPRS